MHILGKGGCQVKKVSQQRMLSVIFEKVYGREFRKEDLDDRVMLQKAVFLLREFGVSCGRYDFVWDHFGPFSPDLSDDMKKEPVDNEDVEFTDKAERVMARLNKLFSDPGEYSVRCWAEAIASLRYLMTHMYPLYSEEKTISKLEEMKSESLSKHSENIRAMKEMKMLFA